MSYTKMDGTIRFPKKFYTKNIFHDFPKNFDLTWIVANNNELQPNFVIPAGFRDNHWIRREILHKICVSGDRFSKWEVSDTQVQI